jgi:hypothetical protein
VRGIKEGEKRRRRGRVVVARRRKKRVYHKGRICTYEGGRNTY